MERSRSFRFLDKDLNQELIRLVKRAKISHSIDKDGVVHYSSDNAEPIENELICSIRDTVFPSWQIITFPDDWTIRYKDYINRHGIPFREEQSNGALSLLIPRRYRPHSWKLDGSTKKERQRRSFTELSAAPRLTK